MEIDNNEKYQVSGALLNKLLFDARKATLRQIELADIKQVKNCSIPDVVKSLPTKEEIIDEGEKQIINWLDGNTEREKQHYRIGFRRSFEYVLRRLK